MASGSTYKNINSHWRLVLEWSSSQDIANNRSSVTVNAYWQGLDAYSRVNSPVVNKGTIRINGSSYGFTSNSSLTANQKKRIGSKTAWVGHNSDGRKSITVDFTFYLNTTLSGTFYGNQTVSVGANLGTIPRASTIGNITGGAVGGVVTVPISRASTSFTHNVHFVRAGDRVQVNNVATGAGTSASFTIAKSDAIKLANSASGTATIKVDTISGGKVIGTTQKNFTVTVPNSGEFLPTITTPTSAISGTGRDKTLNQYVQGTSKVYSTTSRTSGYGAGIKVTTITVKAPNGAISTVGATGGTSGILTQAGNHVITATVEDTRGRKASATRTIAVTGYSAPSITNFTADRTTGTSVSINTKATFSNLGTGNPVTLRVERKPRNGVWVAVKNSPNILTAINDTFTSTGNADTTSYDFKVIITDSFGKDASSTVTISTGKVALSIHKDVGIGVGKVFEGLATLEVAGTVMANGYGSTRLPIGTNLNDVRANGWSHTSVTADAGTMLNCPTDLAFSLFVEQHAGVKQTLTEYRSGYPRTFIRNLYESTWGAWEITFGEGYNHGLARENGWRYYGGSYAIPAYSRSSGGIVTLSGMLDGGTRTVGVRIATLPVGYRPRQRHIFTVHAYNKTVTRIDVTPEGEILAMESPSGYVSLSGIMFIASR